MLAIEQANQDVQQEDCYLQTKCQTHSNFHILKFHVYLILYTTLVTKLNFFKITMKFSRSTVCGTVTVLILHDDYLWLNSLDACTSCTVG